MICTSTINMILSSYPGIVRCLSIYSGRQACGRTSRGHTGLIVHLSSAVLAFIFFAGRIQPFVSLVDREVEFVSNESIAFSTSWAFFFFVRKNPSSCDCTGIRSHVPTSESVEVTNWGRPVVIT